MTRFAFDFSTPLSWPLRLLGVSPWTAHVDVDRGELSVRYGPWTLRTPLTNIASVQVTGPYNPLRSVGVHISLTDRGVTFGTTPQRGVCVTFREPVAAALPTGLLRHPGLTVTVEDVEGLRRLLQDHLDGGTPKAQRISVPRRRTVSRTSTSSGEPTRAQDGPAGAEPTRERPSTAPTRVATPPPRPAKRARPAPAPQPVPTAEPAAEPAADVVDAPVAAPEPAEATPADMPVHASIRRVPGTDVADDGLPPSDAEIAARAKTPVKRSSIGKAKPKSAKASRGGTATRGPAEGGGDSGGATG
jgi:hypothetical protein